MSRFPCPYLAAEIELTEERERHIAERHPDLLPEYREQIADTLADPDQSEPDPMARHWIVTAYLARRLAEGGVEWQQS